MNYIQTTFDYKKNYISLVKFGKNVSLIEFYI